MKRPILVIVILAVVTGLVMGMGSKNAPEKHQKSASGIAGKVEIWEGNFMPMSDPHSANNKILPGANRRVRAHQPVKMGAGSTGAKRDTVTTPLMGETKTDKDGKFFIPLAPGDYSVFVEEDSGWYFNGWSSDGVQGGVTVDSGKTSNVLIKITTKATF